MKILIADDDSARASKLSRYLSSDGVLPDEAITVVGSADEARKLLRATYFDVVILDVVLPKRADRVNPSAQNGLVLLKELSRNPAFHKPERVVGITAHAEDIARFRAEFEEFCSVVVVAEAGTSEWRMKIARAVRDTGASKISRHLTSARTAVISVHGIRTFGQWQSRLQRLVDAHKRGVRFYTYKFGYFSAILFLVPYFRRTQVQRLSERLTRVFRSQEFDSAVIFCHSFGTYLVAHAMQRLVRSDQPMPRVLLVLAGSVLPAEFDWYSVAHAADIRVINDCGDADHVLWVSRSIVLGTGMAGKVGFYGFNDDLVVNRFFRGGHSHYFAGDTFMSRYWVPLVAGIENAELNVDQRMNPSYWYTTVEQIVDVVGNIKPLVYIVVMIFLAYSVV